MIFPAFDHFIWYLIPFILGACIGSFLNVAIYRVPLGMSVNNPKRSFCPHCKAPIPMRRNIPLLSWLLLRGRCADCKARIPFRYFGVELLTAVLFAAVWGWLRQEQGLRFMPTIETAALLPLWIMVALFVAITFIDAEHMIIPPAMTWAGTVAGVAAAALWPRLPDLSGWRTSDPLIRDGLIQSVAGWTIGFCGLWLVVQLGKLVFGRKKIEADEPVPWRLVEGEGEDEPIWFEMKKERIGWWDIFSRKTDRLLVECATLEVNGAETPAGLLTIREDRIELPDGTVVMVEDLKKLEGTAARAVIPREAMGFGDVYLMGMIGAFFGWSGVFFTLFSASLYAIAAAVMGRIGFGRPLPFGPFLILGALTWMGGGWKLAEWYLTGLQTGF